MLPSGLDDQAEFLTHSSKELLSTTRGGTWRKITYVPERNRKTMLHAITRICQSSEPRAGPSQHGDNSLHSHKRMGKPNLGAIDRPVSSALEDG